MNSNTCPTWPLSTVTSLAVAIVLTAAMFPEPASAQARMLSGGQVETGNDTRFAPKFSLQEAVQTREIREYEISPDGRYVAFGYGPIRWGYDNNLQVVDVETGEVRRVTTDEYPSRNPVFSPEGDRLLFSTDNDLWYVNLHTGEQTRVTVSERGEGSAVWSPDGNHVAFFSARRPETYGERGGSTQIWMTDVRELQDRGVRVGLRRVTDIEGLTSLSELQWSPDGGTFLFSAQWPYSVPDPDDTHVTARGIFAADAETGEVTQLTPDDNFTDNFSPRWSPDGSQVAFLSDREGYSHVWVMDPDGGGVRHFDWGPHDSPRMNRVNPQWSPDGTRILVAVNRDGRYDLVVIHVESEEIETVARAMDVGGGMHLSVGWVSNDRVAYVFQNGWSPPDIHVQTLGQPRTEARQLTFSSHAQFREDNMADFERVEFETFDGLTLRGNLLTPRDLQPGDQVPALLWLHGGMYGHSFEAWQPYFHYLAERGYAVGMIDVRGSAGRGRAFREALAEPDGYGPHYLEDLKAAVNFLRDLPYVDADRVGAFGRSHGGYRAVWLMTHEPELLRAGINIVGPTDRRAPYNNRGGRFHIGVSEEDDPEYYDWLSPVTLVDRLRAPVMTVHSDRDVNVPAEMTEKFLAEQIRHGKEYEYVYYRDEPHGFQDPDHILDYYRRMLDFFDRHLKPTEDLRQGGR